jgi:hypothetical protein
MRNLLWHTASERTPRFVHREQVNGHTEQHQNDNDPQSPVLVKLSMEPVALRTTAGVVIHASHD